MIISGEILLSDELFENKFVCDLGSCKGACCVAGDSGAPLEPEETMILEEIFEQVKPYMNEEGIKTIEKRGLWETDEDGDLVTPLVGGVGACAFVIYENGIAKCSIEKAYLEGKVSFKKPISCHLYPIRVSKQPYYTMLNYHRWGLCKPAIKNGKALGVPAFRFLKEPLERKFGKEWYEGVEEIYEEWKKENGK
jgi:hypothetical protein